MAPALAGSRVAQHDGLRDGSRGAAGARSPWFQHSLIVLETSLAVMLLTYGGLLLEAFEQLRNTVAFGQFCNSPSTGCHTYWASRHRPGHDLAKNMSMPPALKASTLFTKPERFCHTIKEREC